MPNVPIDFSRLFRDHYRSVYRYIRFRVDDDNAAEDLTAEVFERAFRARESFDPNRAAFSTWVGRIAHNHLTNYLLSQQRRNRQEAEFDEADPIASSDPTPEAQSIRGDEIRRLQECLKQLSERDRQLIALRFGAEVRNRDIAEQLSLNEHSVSVMLMRALDRLRSCQQSE